VPSIGIRVGVDVVRHNDRVSEPGKAEMLVRVATAMAAQAGGMLDPILGVALAGAKEVIDPVVLAAARRVESAYRARASSVWQVACGESGLEPDDLVARLARDQPTLSLAAEAVEAGMRTAVPEKIVALGRVLAQAALDDAKVDAERLVVAALAALEAPHIRLLHLLAEAPPVRIMQGHEARSLGWRGDEIADRLPGLAEVLDPLVATLTGTALIENVGTVTAPGTITAPPSSHQTQPLWTATHCGRLCLQRLNDDKDSLTDATG